MNQIYTVHADGSNATPLTSDNASGATTGTPVWSPDGTQIAFATSQNTVSISSTGATPPAGEKTEATVVGRITWQAISNNQ